MAKKKEELMQWIYKDHVGAEERGGRVLVETDESFFEYECSNCQDRIKVDIPNKLPTVCPKCGATEYYKESRKYRRVRFG